MSIWFTSDLHINHANILKFCPDSRPFKDIDEMNEVMVHVWNERVGKGDAVYILGDVLFGRLEAGLKIFDQLHGCKHLITGNHDLRFLKKPEFRERFQSISSMKRIKWQKQQIVLCHYSMRVWDLSHHGSWQLFGHSHGSLDAPGLSMDVGLDCHPTFAPFSFDEVAMRMALRTVHNPDHHDTETT